MARYVRVSTISFGGAGGNPEGMVERNRESALEWLRRAALDKPDIVCLPETFHALGLASKEWFASAEPVPGPTTEAVREVAWKNGMYVVCPIVERVDDKVYNSAVLIDREGEIVGRYHKVHPTIGEIECGITPGVETPVFKTDFGNVGCAICFDLNFTDVVAGLKANGAELILFPSMYRGGLQLSIWAFNCSVYIASAYTGEGSAIVNPLGRVLATSSLHNRIISKTINLDYRVLHIDYNNVHWDAIKLKHGADVEIEVATPEAVFALFSNNRNLSVDDLIKEFGLETREEYFKRANRVREKALL